MGWLVKMAEAGGHIRVVLVITLAWVGILWYVGDAAAILDAAPDILYMSGLALTGGAVARKRGEDDKGDR